VAGWQCVYRPGWISAVILSGDKCEIGCFWDRVEALGGVFLVMEMAEGVDLAEYLGEWL
jgi:hypothetical protein